MYKSFVTICIFSVSLSVWAQPKISSPDNTLDFGKHLMSKAVEHAFTIKNDGDAPLLLSGFMYTCGCTVASFDKEELAPGEETLAHAVIKPMGDGPSRKTIYIKSNDPATPLFPLEVSGEWVADVYVENDTRHLAVLKDDAALLEALTVRGGNDSVRFKIVRDIEVSVDWLQYEVQEVVPGQEFLLVPSFVRRPPAGMFNIQVTVHTDNPELPSALAQFTGYIVGDYEISPPQLLLSPAVDGAQQSEYAFHITPGRLGAFEFRELILPDPAIRATKSDIGENQGVTLLIEGIDPNKTCLCGKEIIVKTNLEHPVRIPIACPE